MSTSFTVRNIDAVDKAWLRREARAGGVSMAEFVRRLIRESRERAERRLKPSEVFARHFGPKHGVKLQLSDRYSSPPLSFAADDEG